ncbi:hypothetical protein LINPERHAP2_LOCUS18947, partial [Linum perenne]
CDGSFSQNLPRAGYEIIIKDPHGAAVAGYASTLVCSSPIVAEEKALLIGINMTIFWGEETIVKSDCVDLVDALRKPPSSWPCQCATWLHRMHDILAKNSQIKFLTFSAPSTI